MRKAKDPTGYTFYSPKVSQYEELSFYYFCYYYFFFVFYFFD